MCTSSREPCVVTSTAFTSSIGRSGKLTFMITPLDQPASKSFWMMPGAKCSAVPNWAPMSSWKPLMACDRAMEGTPRAMPCRAPATVPDRVTSSPRFWPRLTPESTRAGCSGIMSLTASTTQAVGVPETAHSRLDTSRTLRGADRVMPRPAPDCSTSGAQTQTSSLSWAAIRRRASKPSAWMPSSLVRRMRMPGLANVGDPAHVGLQHGRHGDAAVVLLVVLHHRHQGAPHRQARAVERVYEARALLAGLAAARIHAPGLEVAAVRAGRDFAIGVLRRQPDLQVVGLARREAHVAGAQQHDAIGQLQTLQHLLGAGHHAQVLGLGLLRRGDRGRLDLGVLVLAG